MKILITGNMGYIGPVLIKTLRNNIRNVFIVGYDTGFYSHCLTPPNILPEVKVDIQYFADVRNIPDEILIGVDSVVCLAALSNDPMGKKFENLTFDINYKSIVRLAERAIQNGIKNFVFASSCSIYGFAEGGPKKEIDHLNPLTAYAKSKVMVEKELEKLDTKGMTITSLRFSTACGMSSRLRLDLVLNDFVACALASKKITVLSDGTPWRPLIDVKDMARAILWALKRDTDALGFYLAVNVGADDRNYQVKYLAETVAAAVPGTTVIINHQSPSDNRSYRVDFSLYRRLAPLYQPEVSLIQSIDELIEGLKIMNFNDESFRLSEFMRIKIIENHIAEGRLNSNLFWQ
jgi:nucleoside-diphosphate-sugar epimerase